MIHTEADHPVNYTNDRILGAVSGGFALSEKQCTCSGCGEDIDHGDSVRVHAVFRSFSIYHKWERKEMFCRECKPTSLDSDLLADSYSNEALVVGTLRDKGYWGTFSDGEGGTEERWTYQDNHYADFAATRVTDRNADPNVGYRVTEIGPRQATYTPESDGKTVPIPETVLEALIESSTIEDDSNRHSKARVNPVRWAKGIMSYHRERERIRR